MDERGGAERRRNKRLKLKEKEDRISDLPDSLLHHILSFLPSTNEAVQTGILSKLWQNQWTRVPFLIFVSDLSMSSDNSDFIRFIDNTLLHHDCLKIKKLHFAYEFDMDTNFSWKIQFAIRKHVEELILDCCSDFNNGYLLPEFFFDNAWLVKLDISNCFRYTMDDCRVSFESLKAFRMEGSADRDLVANVLSGYGQKIEEKILHLWFLRKCRAFQDVLSTQLLSCYVLRS